MKTRRISLIIDNPTDVEFGVFTELLPHYGGDVKGARVDLARDALKALYAETMKIRSNLLTTGKTEV